MNDYWGVTRAVVYGIHPHVTVLICEDGCTRFIHLPTGLMLVVHPHPMNVAQFSHNFADAAAKKAGAQLG
jgi:hypothetical protein